MMRSNDDVLEPHQLATIRKHSNLLLREASALGVFPTPVDQIMAAAKLVVMENDSLDENVLQQLKTWATSPITTMKRALSKVLGLFHASDRLVLIDLSMPAVRKPFIKLHEAGHGTLPHQRGVYAVIQDCEQTLDLETRDLFEREANVFASETLFQGEQFTFDAQQSAFGLKSAMKLADRYGASKYATFRRYVDTSSLACCVLMLDPAIVPESGKPFHEIHRAVCSKSFYEQYDHADFGSVITEGHFLAHLLPKNRMTAPRKIKLQNRNGVKRVCMAEAFNSGRNVFILIRDEGPAPTILPVNTAALKHLGIKG